MRRDREIIAMFWSRFRFFDFVCLKPARPSNVAPARAAGTHHFSPATLANPRREIDKFANPSS